MEWIEEPRITDTGSNEYQITSSQEIFHCLAVPSSSKKWFETIVERPIFGDVPEIHVQFIYKKEL